MLGPWGFPGLTCSYTSYPCGGASGISKNRGRTLGVRRAGKILQHKNRATGRLQMRLRVSGSEWFSQGPVLSGRAGLEGSGRALNAHSGAETPVTGQKVGAQEAGETEVLV